MGTPISIFNPHDIRQMRRRYFGDHTVFARLHLVNHTGRNVYLIARKENVFLEIVCVLSYPQT